jgi:hypothetical protein
VGVNALTFVCCGLVEGWQFKIITGRGWLYFRHATREDRERWRKHDEAAAAVTLR